MEHRLTEASLVDDPMERVFDQWSNRGQTGRAARRTAARRFDHGLTTGQTAPRRPLVGRQLPGPAQPKPDVLHPPVDGLPLRRRPGGELLSESGYRTKAVRVTE
jgi:hypothetical protein